MCIILGWVCDNTKDCIKTEIPKDLVCKVSRQIMEETARKWDGKVLYSLCETSFCTENLCNNHKWSSERDIKRHLTSDAHKVKANIIIAVFIISLFIIL